MIQAISYIIASIAILWVIILFFINLFLFIYFKLNMDSKYIGVIRETNIFNTEFNEWYLIPTISIKFNFDSYHTDLCWIQITYLKWAFNIYYRIKTEEEEKIECEVRQKLLIKNES
jgi:hypothetical protein